MTAHSDSMPGWRKPSADGTPAEEQAQTKKGPETASTTGGGSAREPVVVWEAANRLEAQIVKGRLESHDIPAFIRGEALGTIYGLTTGGLAATEVLVPAPLADKAIDILSSAVEWEEVDDDDAQS